MSKSNGHAHDEVPNLFETRKILIEERFDKEKAAKALDISTQFAKVTFEAYKVKVNSSIPIFEKRSEFIKTIPKFWAQAIQNFHELSKAFVHAVDHKAFEYLDDLKIVYKEDPREYDVEFHFSTNPYFSNSVLVKPFRLRPFGTSSSSSAPEKEIDPYYLDYDLHTTAVNIEWKDDEHNLVKIAPAKDISELEEYDEVDISGLSGSFFNWFEANEDKYGVCELIPQLHADAIDIYVGLKQLSEDDDGEDEEDEEDEDDEDDEAEIDLDEEENRRAKKRPRRG